MALVFCPCLPRLERHALDEDELPVGGPVATEVEIDLHARTVRVGQERAALLPCLAVLAPPMPQRPTRVALDAHMVLCVTGAGAFVHDLLCMLRHVSAGDSMRASLLPFFGRVHVRDAAARVRRAQLPPVVYGPFRKLAPALELVLGHRELRVWSVESERGQGARDYVVASLDEFWRFYEATPASRRFHYEVIVADAPTRLFLDIEYAYGDEHTRDGWPRVTSLLLLLTHFVADLAFVGRVDDPHCVVLESTYAAKFSQHVVFPGVVFRDVHACGALVLAFREHVRLLAAANDPHAVRCFVDDVFICDCGVYNTHRNFRLVYSTKRGKDAPMLPVGADIAPEWSVFLQSLVIPALAPESVLDYDAPAAKPRARHVAVAHTPGTFGHRSQEHAAADAFVRSIIGDAGGYVRTVVPGSDSVLFSIAGGYRWCANVGRHHKSNNVYLIADLRTRMLFQRCYDPDCAGFQSQGLKIPPLIAEDALISDQGELARAFSLSLLSSLFSLSL